LKNAKPPRAKGAAAKGGPAPDKNRRPGIE
jgi:hypothetical protein